MDRFELGQELRTRRKAAGRTVASVAADAGLSMPYVANLENGRGNPTVSALQRLATALGTRLQISLREDGAAAPAVSEEMSDLLHLAKTPRAQRVAARLADLGDHDIAVVEGNIHDLLVTLRAVLGHDPTERDLDRLLDLLLLASGRL